MIKNILPILLLSFVFSCKKKENLPVDYNDLKNLPTDTGGEHRAFPLGNTDAPLGYYEYLPSNYIDIEDVSYPLLIFLHGAGEKGNSENNADKLDLVLRNGPPKLIEGEKWSPKYPMIVISPQCHTAWWNGNDIETFINFIKENYRVNERRIYLTGLSMGGFGTFDYITRMGIDGQVAAAVPICGGGNVSKVANCAHVPIWAFHGDNDNVVKVNKSIDFANAYNNQTPSPKLNARLTIYPGVGHNSWKRTYDNSGMGSESSEYDAFDMSIYDWMFQFEK